VLIREGEGFILVITSVSKDWNSSQDYRRLHENFEAVGRTGKDDAGVTHGG